MSYRVRCGVGQGNGYSITSLIQLIQASNPAQVNFLLFGNENVTKLGPGQGDEIAFSGQTSMVRCISLISCASICFVYQVNAIGYVYHANAGAISQAKFNAAIQAMNAQGNLGQVYIAYAHPNASDPQYQDSVAQLVQWGIPTNNVVEITNIAVPSFGMNNSLQIGY